MEARIPFLADIPLCLRFMIRIAADFLIIGTPLWICLTLNLSLRLLDRPTEWALILTAAVLFTFSVIRHGKRRHQGDADGQGLVFLEVLLYHIRRLRGIHGQPKPEEGKSAIAQFVGMQWVFLPLMFQFTYLCATQFMDELATMVHTPAYGSVLFWFHQILFPLSLCLVFLIDFLWYSLSYVLGNSRRKLRAASFQAWGWILALISLLPLYFLIDQISPLKESALAQFKGNLAATSLVRLGIWVCLLVYLWSLLSLGFRRTHLSHMGVVDTGAYRWVRHPGYSALLGIGWLALLPLMLHNPLWTLPMMAWTGLLIWRAQLEENLLLSDPLYRDYMRKVPYRFLPHLY